MAIIVWVLMQAELAASSLQRLHMYCERQLSTKHKRKSCLFFPYHIKKDVVPLVVKYSPTDAYDFDFSA